MDRPGADAAISPVVTGPATVVGERRGEAATVAARRSQRRRTAPRTVLAVAALGSAVAFIDATIVNIALLAAVAAAAAGLGPSLGGLLVAAANWRLVFLVNLPIGIAAVVLSRRLLMESRGPERRRLPDLLGGLVFAVAVAALVLAIVKG